MLHLLGLQGAEAPGDLHEAFHGDILIADREHVMIEKRPVDRRDGFGAERIVEIEPGHLDAEGRIERADVELRYRHAHPPILIESARNQIVYSAFSPGTGVAAMPPRFRMEPSPPIFSMSAR